MPLATERQRRGNRQDMLRAMAIQFGLLGELRVEANGARLPLGGARQKALLARLLVSRNELTRRDRLVADLYGAAHSGPKALQVAIARLRRSLAPALGEHEPQLLVSRDGGYLLRVGDDQLDAWLFERSVAAAEEAMNAKVLESTEAHLRDALSLWRGPPLAELPDVTWARPAVVRLRELHARALELRSELTLALGGHKHAIAELEELVALHPAREHAWGLLMIAFYRVGRQADALVAYREARRHLVEAHGIEPGPALRDLQRAILLQDPALREAPVSSATLGLLAAPPSGEEPAGSRFVGRVGERAALDAALARTSAGQRVAAMISGEPGIGKTRLATELARQAHREGFAILFGRCEADLELPFKPFVEALGQLLTTTTDDAVRTHVREHERVLARLLPLSGSDGARGEPAPVASAATAPSAASDASAADTSGLQYALFAAVAGLLVQAGAGQPVLLVLEDLHWADRSSLLLLGHLLTTPTRPRLMVLGTYRSNELEPGHPLQDLLADLHREPGVLRMELVGLLDTEVAELAGLLFGDRPGLEPEALRAVRTSTDGNPFFVTEVLHALVESGATAAEFDPEGSLPLPTSIRETVYKRVARLGEPAGASLAGASVLGTAFDPELVPALVERPSDDVLDALDAAAAAGLLIEEGDQLAFRHALIAQTLYEGISLARRRSLHRRAAGLLEQRADAGDRGVTPAAVARHWIRASPRGVDAERAVDWVRRAGDDAIARLSPQEAQRSYQRALTLSAGQLSQRKDERCALLVELGTAQRQSGDPAFRDTLLQAARIALACGDHGQLVRAALANTRGFVSATGGVDEERIAILGEALAATGPGQTSTRARLLATLAGELTFTGQWRRRVKLADEALEMARALGDPRTLVDVLIPRSVTIWSPATLADRLAATAECRQAADVVGDPLAQFHAVHWRASACVEAGAFVEAAECRRRARHLADRLRQPTVLWMAGYDRANEAIMSGALDDAERLANEAYEIGHASGQPDALLILASQLMVVRYEQGRLGETIELIGKTLEDNPRITGFRAALALGHSERRRYREAAAVLLANASDRFSALPYDLTWISVLSLYAHVAARTFAAGFAPANVLETIHSLLRPWHDQIAYMGAGGFGPVQHYLGMLELALGDTTGAAARLESALSRAELLGAPIWAARSRLELGRALLVGGEGDRARRLLELAASEARALGARTIAREAGELLARRVPAGRAV